MPIKELQPRQGNVDIVVEVIEVGEAREFQKFGKTGRVATAKVKDDSGEINLTLWNDSIDKVKKGDKVHIKNGYVNEFQGEMQLTTGKFGSLEVVGEAEGGDEEDKEIPPSEEVSQASLTSRPPTAAPETDADEKESEPKEESAVEEEKVE